MPNWRKKETLQMKLWISKFFTEKKNKINIHDEDIIKECCWTFCHEELRMNKKILKDEWTMFKAVVTNFSFFRMHSYWYLAENNYL